MHSAHGSPNPWLAFGRIATTPAFLLTLALATGCSRAGSGAPPASQGAAADQQVDGENETLVRSSASVGVVDGEVAALLEDHWAWAMETFPEWTTQMKLADGRYDHAVTDSSLAGAEAQVAALRAFEARAEAIDRARLSERDGMFLRLFQVSIAGSIATSACRDATWVISTRFNPISQIQRTLDVQDVETPEAREAYLARILAWANEMPDVIAALKVGMASGRTASASSVRQVITMVKARLSAPVESWPMYRLPKEGAAERDAFGEALHSLLETHARPAMTAYVTLLETSILPVARPDDHPGLNTLDVGPACYRGHIESSTGLPLTAEALHQTGLDALKRVHTEFAEAGSQVFGTADLSEVFERLRTDPAMYFETEEEILSTATAALARAQEALPTAFGSVPSRPCEIVAMTPQQASEGLPAFYRKGDSQGSRPGRYHVNTSLPTTRARYQAEAIAFHEAVPGHHLQFAASLDLAEVPAFHRFGGSQAFHEGWGMYVERLADELSLYSGPVDRLGMLALDAWRAARLVVDTGVHHHGWSRGDAERFMRDNTPLSDEIILAEVERYITRPGQALAYKTGQIEILALRAKAEETLGDDFDLSAFHAAVLREGAVSLPVLRERIDAWLAEPR